MTEPYPATPAADPAVAASVLRLATAYQASDALHVAVRLGLPDLMGDGARSADELAAATGSHAPSLRRLLRALVAFDVFAEQGADGRFALGPLGALLRAGVPGSLRDPVLLFGHADLRRSWDELERCLRTGETATTLLFGDEDPFARYAADPDFGPVFNAAMSALSAADAAAAVAAYDFSRFSRVVDVGGGHGGLLAEVLRAAPRLRGVLFDLPPVAERAALALAEAGVAGRCEVVGGDMFAGVPQGGDLYILKAVIHDWDDERAIAVLANCRAAMAERDGARLLLVERLLPERIAPTQAIQAVVLNDLNMLVRTGGRERSEAEFRTLLDEAGLRLTGVVTTGGPLDMIEAARR